LLLSDLSLESDTYRATGIPTPYYNVHGWSRIGHLLSFDQPAPIGFSYCNTMDENNDRPHACGDIAWTDELTAQNAYAALTAFYTDKFPMLRTNDLYLTGESYAGIYIPTLAREILRHNSDITNSNSSDGGTIPLKGFAVGDGCLGTETKICGGLNHDKDPFDVLQLVFLAGHGQIPMNTFQEVMKACRPHSTGNSKCDDDFASAWLRGLAASQDGVGHSSDDPACRAALAHVEQQVGGVYAYGLYDECVYSGGLRRVAGSVNDYPCGGDVVMQQYLDLPVVRQALHVESEFYSVDNAEGDFDYTPTEPDLQDFYKSVNGKLRVLVYNGGR
jgi:serine carboxypeptidase-like clade I